MNLLIPYVHLYNHPDPLFSEFTYGDSTKLRARKLKNALEKGDYIFFHTTVRGRKYVTAYYVVDRVLDTSRAANDANITAKYRNPHIMEYLSGKRTNEDDVVLFGDPITSRILERPLLFDKTLAEKLSLNIKFPKEKTETQVISSATRAWRELKGRDVEILLKAIRLSEKEGIHTEAIISTDEVTEIIEKDIEKFIEKSPSLIGDNLSLNRRQLDTPVGRIDLLFEDSKGNLVVVELKLNKIGREAINQLRRYMDWVGKETKKEVSGVIVCKGVMPAFQEEFQELKNIRILLYGWQLKVYS